MANKLPAFQFYPADWRKDPAVQSLSYHDKGIWFEILCLMHESEERGKLLLNGKPMPEEALARLLGLDKQILTKTLTTLLDYGVASRDDYGALMSRRMVRDETLRKIRTEAGKKGGNPNLVNQNNNQNGSKIQNEVNQNSTPSSSSSKPVSFSDEKKTGSSQRGRAREDLPTAAGNSQTNGKSWQWLELTPEEDQMPLDDFLIHLEKLEPEKNVSEIFKKVKSFCVKNKKDFAKERIKGWVYGEVKTISLAGEPIEELVIPNIGKLK